MQLGKGREPLNGPVEPSNTITLLLARSTFVRCHVIVIMLLLGAKRKRICKMGGENEILRGRLLLEGKSFLPDLRYSDVRTVAMLRLEFYSISLHENAAMHFLPVVLACSALDLNCGALTLVGIPNEACNLST